MFKSQIIAIVMK